MIQSVSLFMFLFSPPVKGEEMDKLKRDIENNPDLYQYERANIFKVSKSAICAAIKGLGITHKKNSKSS